MNQYQSLVDKFFRPVNNAGFLINESEDIINNDGQVMFKKSQLQPAGNLKQLFTYKGEAFFIQDIIGQFGKDPESKEIILKTDPKTGLSVDNLGRRVNAAGYLIDKDANVINKKGKIMFFFWELLYQEPPKIFEFTKFSMQWIRGRMNKDVTQNPRHNDEFDMDGRKINTMGYLIDDRGNIVDKHGKEVFKVAILSEAFGQDAQIPLIFRSGKLQQPDDSDDEDDMQWRYQNVLPSNPRPVKAKPSTGNSTRNNISHAMSSTKNETGFYKQLQSTNASHQISEVSQKLGEMSQISNQTEEKLIGAMNQNSKLFQMEEIKKDNQSE